ncbi:MAG: Crossover junction endodeoxyribonuclease RuvC [Chlamydiales bacterium]|nr:Crossover junction endodeoxyribonuclease RuvC [Chlamydiales bacterium]MCH9635721.1 Crossover junction endodeoxyribonuclease RuvC [Chlamydiales bacterium]MCH9704163.1 crossover junction endodeoxyribonuclease RuvC [Chlamydiota bacterium]
MSRILGIDPGTRITGYGIIEDGKLVDFGCIRPPTSLPLHERYAVIHRGVLALIKKFEPRSFAIETQYVSKNVSSAMKLGMARGVAVLAATLHEIPVFEYAPSRAKRAVVGNGAASKEQVQEMTARLLGLKEVPKPEDAADALALAICHSHTERCTNISKGR